MADAGIRHLDPEDASAIVKLFGRVYGDSYANELFYDVVSIARSMRKGELFCVGAYSQDKLLAHMAMTRGGATTTPELGNTVVDPDARGGGLAWKVGVALTAWCRSLGHEGYLHFPTTDHHIMQRQSVKQGFETGLMLGYIPAETHGQVGEKSKTRRSAATIVYEPLSRDMKAQHILTPAYYRQQIDSFVQTTDVPRIVDEAPIGRPDGVSATRLKVMAVRSLSRLTFDRIGEDAGLLIREMRGECQQIDFRMDDRGIEFATGLAGRAGFAFSGWLPGYLGSDVLRLQKFDERLTDLSPALENNTAKSILGSILVELSLKD